MNNSKNICNYCGKTNTNVKRHIRNVHGKEEKSAIDGNDNNDSKIDSNNKKRKEIDKVLNTLDVFDSNVILDIHKDKCALCKQGHEYGKQLKDLLNKGIEMIDEYEEVEECDPNGITDYDNIWVSKYSLLHKGRRIFVHNQCAIASPQAIFEKNQWYNLSKEVNRSRSLKCKDCNETGATIGCIEKKCCVVMHFPCAVKLGYKIMHYKRAFVCADHALAHMKQEELQDLRYRNDISKGLELLPINITTTSNQIKDFSILTNNFEYTVENLDSDHVIMNRKSVKATDCCTCVDLCDNVATCECLAMYGRNYNYNNTLIPGLNHRRILECNWACKCSLRRCTNRLVERGLTAHLEIFEVNKQAKLNNNNNNNDSNNNNNNNIDSNNNNNYNNDNNNYTTIFGVRTLDFIPENTFVCEVTGQYLYGNSISYNYSSKYNKFEGGLKLSELLLQPKQSITKDNNINGNEFINNNSNNNKVIIINNSNQDINRIIPIDMWEESMIYPINTWVLQKINESQHTNLSNDYINSINYNSNSNEFNDDDDDDNNNSDNNNRLDSNNINEYNNYSKLYDQKQDQMIEYLNGKLCIDSRYFGNVSSFIRRSTTNNNNDRMLYRKLIYTNRKDGNHMPKLALFASRNIEANTELFI